MQLPSSMISFLSILLFLKAFLAEKGCIGTCAYWEVNFSLLYLHSNIESSSSYVFDVVAARMLYHDSIVTAGSAVTISGHGSSYNQLIKTERMGYNWSGDYNCVVWFCHWDNHTPSKEGKTEGMEPANYDHVIYYAYSLTTCQCCENK